MRKKKSIASKHDVADADDHTGLLPTNPVARRAYGKMLRHKRKGAERARLDRETQLASARTADGEQPPPPSPGGFGHGREQQNYFLQTSPVSSAR